MCAGVITPEMQYVAARENLTAETIRDEVAALLERNLARTAPTPLFTTQVVAALPALAAQTTGISATAKGAAAVKGGGLLAILVGWVAPLGFLLALLYGTVQDVRQSKTPRQRRLRHFHRRSVQICVDCRGHPRRIVHRRCQPGGPIRFYLP